MTKKKKENFYLYIPLLIIMIISLFIMYHASFISSLYEKLLLKQSIFFSIGIFLLLIKDKIKTKWLFDYSFFIYLGNTKEFS